MFKNKYMEIRDNTNVYFEINQIVFSNIFQQTILYVLYDESYLLNF